MNARGLLLTIVCLVWACTGSAQQNPAEKARVALASLEAASLRLDQAEGARDRVRALTETIQAFEQGLGAMREGLRQAAIQERVLTQKLDSQEMEIAALVSVLQTMGRSGSPTALLHPSGAIGTARAGMLLAELGPALNARAQVLRRDLVEVQTLRSLQQAAADRMAGWLSEVQSARTGLNHAMAERTNLPRRFTADPTRSAILIASAETLDGFASGLSQVVIQEFAPPLQMTSSRPPGEWPLPVQGIILRRPGEPDAAGVARPGVLVATRPQALVTSPSAATIRYAGPLLDFGQVMILEPEAGSSLIFAGLAQVYGSAGQVISEATPVGLMGGRVPGSTELLSPSGEGAGTDRSETLYIEVRLDNRPIDPATWFALGPKR